MKSIVYGLIDTDSRQLRYIGKTNNTPIYRLKQHISEAKRSDKPTVKMKWLRDLASLNKEPEIIILEEYESEEAAYQAEFELVKYYRSIGCELYNLCDGGGVPNNYKHTPEHKEYISKVLSGRSKPEGFGELVRQRMLGNNPSEATREKKRQAMKACNFGGENNPFYGRHHTEETKALLSEIGKTKPVYKRTQFHLDRMSEIHKGKKISEEQKAQLREANRHKMKQVRLLETGEIFESVKETSKATGCHPGNIAKCCNGKARSSMGLHFEYVKD
jgi:group I intron endonuclease